LIGVSFVHLKSFVEQCRICGWFIE